MEKPYHHIYKDGKLFGFRNLEGGPKRDPNFKWNWKVFSEEKKKLKINYPPEHVIDKQEVLKNVTANQILKINYQNAVFPKKPNPIFPKKETIFEDVTATSGVNFTHTENAYDDYKQEI